MTYKDLDPNVYKDWKENECTKLFYEYMREQLIGMEKDIELTVNATSVNPNNLIRTVAQSDVARTVLEFFSYDELNKMLARKNKIAEYEKYEEEGSYE